MLQDQFYCKQSLIIILIFNLNTYNVYLLELEFINSTECPFFSMWILLIPDGTAHPFWELTYLTPIPIQWLGISHN